LPSPAPRQTGLPLLIEPGGPWENGYCESFIGRLRDGLPNRKILDTLLEAKVLVERCRRHYNRLKPHSALGYRAPASEATEPAAPHLRSPPPAAAGWDRISSTEGGTIEGGGSRTGEVALSVRQPRLRAARSRQRGSPACALRPTDPRVEEP